MRIFRRASACCSKAGVSASSRSAFTSGAVAWRTRRSLGCCCRGAAQHCFPRDEGFYDRSLCHAGYSLIYLDVNKYETAAFIRRVLRQKDLNTEAKRMGTVVRVSAAGLWVWRAHAGRAARLMWE